MSKWGESGRTCIVVKVYCKTSLNLAIFSSSISQISMFSGKKKLVDETFNAYSDREQYSNLWVKHDNID